MKKKHIIMIALVLVMLLVLTGCSGADKSMLPISGPNGKGVDNDGWFVWILVRPIAFFIDRFSVGGSLALGIILTTIMIRTLAWPVYAKSNDMSLKMTLAQPEMTRIQAKYANRKDPMSQQKMQKEMMAVWKKYKINPLGCLIVPLIQFPLFMAMYNAVQRYPNGAYTYADDAKKFAGETKTVCSWFKHMNTDPAKCDLHTRFCGIDLSKGITNITELGKISNWVYVILPILVGITMVACQLVSQMKPSYAKKAYPNQNNPQADQTKKMMRIMMIFMTAMMVLMSFRSGTLALYWVIGNLFTIVQTLISRKINEVKWTKAQETNTITGVKVKVEKPKKESKAKKEETIEAPKEPKEKKLKPTMAPKSKSKALDVVEEESKEVNEEEHTLTETNDEEVFTQTNDEIVDADFEEIEESTNDDTNNSEE